MMTTLRNIFNILIFALLCSCNSASKAKPGAIEYDSIVSDTTGISDKPNNWVRVIQREQVDTVTTIKFNEFSVSISRLVIYDKDKKIEKTQKDTVDVYVELGETIEGQIISVSNEQLTHLTIEQRFETSVTIMNEGPHCDLTEWKHFYSDWKQLQTNNNGQFICEKYSKMEREKFPKISIDELKQHVKHQCGEEWLKLVERVELPTEYPSGVAISRYYLRITGQSKDNGKRVIKVIILETPMGC